LYFPGSIDRARISALVSLNELRGPPPMKIRNSLRSLRNRHRGNRLVRRKGRVYIINKTNRRYKARQG